MIIKESESKYRQWASLLLSVLLVLSLLALVVWVFFPKYSPDTLSPDVIYCDAEQVEEDQFISAGQHFSGGSLQTDAFSKSGKYSCKLPKVEGTQYGFSYTMKNLIPGQAYKASVWRLKNIYQLGNLVVQARGKDGFYKRSNTAVQTADGWELLEIRFYIPFQKEIDDINIHVFSNGLQELYFDDLKIERIHQFENKDFQPEVLNLQIDQKNWVQLEAKRRSAINAGVLESSDDDWVTASILRDSSDAIPVKVRLKGDWLDHLVGDKWSFRIKVDDAHAWKRMKTFSLHTPSARHYLHEWLLHQLWEKEDVLTTRYDFIELRINDQSLGIYAYEEHFEKQLLEYKARREGPILKFSETGYWQGVKRQLNEQGYLKPNAEHSAMNPNNADISAFKENRIAKSPALAAQYKQAQNLLYQFRQRLQPAETIFDLPLLAKYYAICDLMNAYHGIVWHNQRFYFNPVTNKLEPIGFDGYGEKPSQQLGIIGHGALHPALQKDESLAASLFMDKAFVALYTAELERLSKIPVFRAFLDEMYPALQARLEWLQMEFPDYNLSREALQADAGFVHSLILPFENQSIKTFLQSEENDKQQLLVRNTHTLPVEIIGFGGKQGKVSQQLEVPLLLPGQARRELLARLQRDSQERVNNFESLRFQDAVAMANQEIADLHALEVGTGADYLFFRPLGIDTIFSTRIRPWPLPTNFSIAQAIFEDATPTDYDILQVDGNVLHLSEGAYTVSEDIVIPEGYQLDVEAGVQLTFTNQAALISRSPVQLMGTEENPIIIRSEDKKSGSFIILQTKELSKLRYVIFDNINTLERPGWTLTGAVSFYEADVDIDRCVFKQIPSEDALNIVRSNFNVDHCRFMEVQFDAFDSDFCKGEVRNSVFINVGNDGIDFSGSVVNIRDCQMINCGDKGISVGEETDANVFSSRIESCPIAVASKDLSVLYIDYIDLKNCDQGFVAFEKKAEFGGSKIIVKDYKTDNIKRLHAISTGCTLQLKEQLISAQR
jgi:hypothetical protein